MSRTRSKPLLIIIRLILVGMIIFGAVGIYRVVNEVNAGKANFDSGIEAIRPAADDTELRLAYAFLTICTCFSGVLFYIVAWIVMPDKSKVI